MSEALTAPEADRSAEDHLSPWRAAERPDLRRGVWTRLGDERILGDDATESVLGKLAERARSAAQAQGYAVGWTAGQQAALRRGAEQAAAEAAEAAHREAARAREHASAIAGLRVAASALSAAAEEIAERIGAQATDLAFELTETLLGHELSAAADPGRGVVARAVSALPRNPTASVRLHPATAVSSAADELAEHGVEVILDPSLDLYDAVVETDVTAVDLRLSEALVRLREALS